jgi:hypothetical protein
MTKTAEPPGCRGRCVIVAKLFPHAHSSGGNGPESTRCLGMDLRCSEKTCPLSGTAMCAPCLSHVAGMTFYPRSWQEGRNRRRRQDQAWRTATESPTIAQAATGAVSLASFKALRTESGVTNSRMAICGTVVWPDWISRSHCRCRAILVFAPTGLLIALFISGENCKSHA